VSFEDSNLTTYDDVWRGIATGAVVNLVYIFFLMFLCVNALMSSCGVGLPGRGCGDRCCR